MPLWGEQSRVEVHDIMKKFKLIVSVEEHLLAGGFSSWLMESELCVKPITLYNSVCGQVGIQKFLIENYGLNIQRIHDKLTI